MEYKRKGNKQEAKGTRRETKPGGGRSGSIVVVARVCTRLVRLVTRGSGFGGGLDGFAARTKRPGSDRREDRRGLVRRREGAAILIILLMRRRSIRL